MDQFSSLHVEASFDKMLHSELPMWVCVCKCLHTIVFYQETNPSYHSSTAVVIFEHVANLAHNIKQIKQLTLIYVSETLFVYVSIHCGP